MQKITCTCIALTLLMSMLSIPAFAQDKSETAKEIYTEDFERGIGSEWSNSVSTTIDKSTVLGTFNESPVTLTLPNAPVDVNMTICFDLWVMDSWDGNSDIHGPDVFSVALSPDRTLLSTTFSNTYDDPIQSYPKTYGEEKMENHAFTTGAAKTGEFNGHFTRFTDSKYEICRTFLNTDELLNITFSAHLTQGMSDESFGIDNVSISVEQPVMEANITEQIQCLEQVALSPNPAKSDIRLSVSGTCNNFKGSVYDELGKLIIKEVNMTNGEANVNISQLAEGTYFLHLTDDTQTSIHRFVKVKQVRELPNSFHIIIDLSLEESPIKKNGCPNYRAAISMRKCIKCSDYKF